MFDRLEIKLDSMLNSIRLWETILSGDFIAANDEKLSSFEEIAFLFDGVVAVYLLGWYSDFAGFLVKRKRFDLVFF